MNQVPDQKDRDAARESLDKSIFLGAGAGAGKSTTLIDRILEVLTSQAQPLRMDEIVAITFTEKAGTDLRQRLRREIIVELEKTGNKKLENALKSLEDAKVGTIHSFAQSILREFAIEAGLPPGFQVLSDGTSSRAKTLRAREVLSKSKTINKRDTELMHPDISRNTLLDFVKSIDDSRLLIDSDAIIREKPADKSVLFSIFDSELVKFEMLVANYEGKEDDKLYIQVKPILAALEALRQNEYIGNTKLWATDYSALIKPITFGSKDNWGEGVAEKVRNSWASSLSALKELVNSDLENDIRDFIAETLTELDVMAKQRTSEGFLEFDDLLSLTRGLLRQNENVRSKLHNKYRFILVDEFQDTDPVQWEIVKLITSDPSDAEKLSPIPGRLLVVGDPKQAIFSFRGADIRTYQKAQLEFQDFGEELELTTNFRSTPEIIDWVNKVFEPAMNQPAQVKYKSLLANRATLEKTNPSVTVLRLPEGEVKPKQAEAALIAQSVARAVQEKWQVSYKDGHVSRQRHAKFSDIAIIYPTRTSLDDLLNEFESVGIPYRASDSRLVLERPIVKGLVSLIRSIADESDELSTWEALKTPIFGCTDTELFEFKKLNGRWSGFYRNETNAAAAETYVGKSILKINNIRDKNYRSSPTELIDTICRELNLFEITAVSPRGGFDADCLMMFRNYAQDWQEAGGTGILEFCDSVDDFDSAGARVNFAAPDDKSDDAVQLMTIFGAKGLEFPIVAVSGLSTRFKQKDSPAIVFRPSGKIEYFITKEISSPGWEKWKKEVRNPSNSAERIRILYVAATRAQDALIFSLVAKPTVNSVLTWAGLVETFIPESESDVRTDSVIQIEPDASLNLSDVASSWLEKIPSLRKTSALPYVALPSGKAASVLGLIDTEGVQENSIFTIGNSTAGESLQYRDGAALGQAVHSGLDFVMNYQGEINDEVFNLAVQSAEASILTVVDESDVLSRLKSAYESEIFQRALKAERKWPELYLSAPVDHEQYKLIEGFADLVFKDSDGYTIVDYKTDKEINAETFQHYQEQLLSYEELFTRCTGFAVNKLCILHITEKEATVQDIYRN